MNGHKTFLDLVREMGQLALEKCHDKCEVKYHRMEAAQYLSVLLENPELARDVFYKARWRQARRDNEEHA